MAEVFPALNIPIDIISIMGVTEFMESCNIFTESFLAPLDTVELSWLLKIIWNKIVGVRQYLFQ